MKTQRTITYVLCVALLIAMPWGTVQADPSFFDDFSDGDAQDGSPISWLWNVATADVAVVNGDLIVRPKVKKPSVPFPWIMAKDTNSNNGQEYAGDLVVTAQFTMTQPGDASAGIYVRSALPEDRQGYVGGIYATNQLFLERDDGVSFSNKVVFGKYSIPGFNIGSEDLILQLSVSDFLTPQGTRSSRIELRAWRPGEEMPTQPQVSANDSKYTDGFAGLYVDSGAYAPGLSDITVRWIEVVDSSVELEPIVDFNGDGTVDLKDLLKMIQCWGQDEPAVDIVPDGVVDEQDLEVLMEHWQQDVNDPTLLAHWALDETEGMIAFDSAGSHDGTVLGLPAWQPAGGAVDGALEFDGTTFIVADHVLHPSDGPFSVFAWVKGGAPGQVILSQANSTNWLMADASQGLLTTELKSAGRFSSPLCSQTAITDGDWHRVGMVSDGSNRILYVDDVEVAQDTQTNLMGTEGGLYIGAGKTCVPGTFFTGLIDDVRIYSRTVKPLHR